MTNKKKIFILSILKNVPFFRWVKSLINSSKSDIAIGDGTFVDKTSQISKTVVLYSNVKIIKSKIGDYTYVSSNSSICHASIGKYCSIGADVKVSLGVHPTDYPSSSPVFYSKNNAIGFNFFENVNVEERKQVLVGNDVWIGEGVKILDGVKIGDGAIIATGAIVVKDVDAYSIVGGVPAKHIKFRFDENTIKHLLELQWWNKEHHWLILNKQFFTQRCNIKTISQLNLR